jgi:hypothetical protein
MTNSGCEHETNRAQGHTLLFGLIITQHSDVALTSDVQPKYTVSKLHVVMISAVQETFPSLRPVETSERVRKCIFQSLALK